MEKKKIVEIIKKGGVGILATDTLYGLVGSALSSKAVSRIYQLKKRNKKKPFIILISSFKDLSIFNIKIEGFQKRILKKIWPGKVSVIFPCPLKKWAYLHRGTKSLAFRLVKKKSLRELLKKTGPLVAPSANLEGQKPVETLQEARRIFGDRVDFYSGRIRKNQLPSTLVAFQNKHLVILRKGGGRIPKYLLK